uniref:Uncharacterized protein n=1 Tax=Arion vulgaris TaxID=1028688 RepID=A0A0B6ZF27_9EUPU
MLTSTMSFIASYVTKCKHRREQECYSLFYHNKLTTIKEHKYCGIDFKQIGNCIGDTGSKKGSMKGNMFLTAIWTSQN